MRPTKTIRNKIEVNEPSKTLVYGSGRHPAKPDNRSNVFLVGPRGSGKTTLGRILAEHLQLCFADTDALIVAKTGRSIEEVVRTRGWDGFRNLEHEVLGEVCTREHQVVATGGGIVLMAANRSLMQSCGRVFYLLAEVPLLLQRIQDDPLAEQRPPLSGLPLREEMARTLYERSPLYMESADFILNAEDSPEELTQKAAELLKL
jgi:shikimate kinase